MHLLLNHLIRLLSFIVPILITFTLVILNVRFALNSLELQIALFDRNNVSALSTFSTLELEQIAIQIQNYFNSNSKGLFVVLADRNGGQNLFTANEVAHMSDVKDLFHFFFILQTYAVIAIFISTVLLYGFMKSQGSLIAARWLIAGGMLTVSVILLVGFISIVAFDPLFTLFHYVGFPQGNWTFNARTSALVQVFPLGFWKDITLIVAGLSVFEALFLIR